MFWMESPGTYMLLQITGWGTFLRLTSIKTADPNSWMMKPSADKIKVVPDG
jgi:hypothetical protein